MVISISNLFYFAQLLSGCKANVFHFDFPCMKVTLSKQQIVLIVGRKMNIGTADKLVKVSLRFAYFFAAET